MFWLFPYWSGRSGQLQTDISPLNETQFISDRWISFLLLITYYLVFETCVNKLPLVDIASLVLSTGLKTRLFPHLFTSPDAQRCLHSLCIFFNHISCFADLLRYNCRSLFLSTVVWTRTLTYNALWPPNARRVIFIAIVLKCSLPLTGKRLGNWVNGSCPRRNW